VVIDIRNVHVERGGKHILKDITCGVPKGQIVGLIGPSGSGKTTLMRTIIGAQRIKSGTVLIMDEFAGDPSLRAHIGYMAQGNGVYANLSVMENLRYFARLLGVNRAGCEQVLRLVELEPQRTQTVATLSGGQQARVSLAVALLGTPPLLVLDEPTVGLDPLLRQNLWRLFAQLAEAGSTLLISSHVMDEAERCHELLLMRDGQLIAQGSVMSLLQRTHTNRLEDAFVSLAQKQRSEDV
jgi:ABC-2 type transport system ATP-binding protein